MDKTEEMILLLNLEKAIAPIDYDKLGFRSLDILRYLVRERKKELMEGLSDES